MSQNYLVTITGGTSPGPYTIYYNTINNNFDTLLLVFLGNEALGIELLNKIIQYKKINPEFNIAFCINNNLVKNTR